MPAPARPRRAGFTLVELMIVSSMMVFLAVMISDVWASLGRSLGTAMDEARVAEEAQFLMESLRRDLSGYYPGEETSKEDRNRMVGRSATADSRLLICFDGDGDGTADWADPDIVIVYEKQGDQLLRINQTDKGRTFPVANHVETFQAIQLATGLRIDFTISRQEFSRSFTLVSRDP